MSNRNTCEQIPRQLKDILAQVRENKFEDVSFFTPFRETSKYNLFMHYVVCRRQPAEKDQI